MLSLRACKKNFIKIFFIIGIFFPCMFAYAFSLPKNIPKQINLIFPDQILTLNFQAQPGLLKKVPKHNLKIGKRNINVNLKEKLSPEYSFLKIKTQFDIEINKRVLHEFFVESFLLQEKNSDIIKIYFDENDKIIFKGSPSSRYQIEEEKLIKLINQAIKTKQENIRVPAEKIFSKIEIDPKLQKKGIQEIIAMGESNFKGSSKERKKNIQVAADLFNGVIIPKNQIFSFNKILGEVNAKKGFVKELVIKGNETEKEFGGGTCQVSTTAFRAAFSGGFPIVNRKPHSYAVPYYKPYGLDATVYIGAADLRFKNDSPGDLLIQTFIEENNLYFIFYGTSDRRQVSLEGPFLSHFKKPKKPIIYETDTLEEGAQEMISAAYDGFRAEWIRRIKKSETNNENNSYEIKDNLVSHYRSWPARILAGTKKNISQNEENIEDKDEDKDENEPEDENVIINPVDKENIMTQEMFGDDFSTEDFFANKKKN